MIPEKLSADRVGDTRSDAFRPAVLPPLAVTGNQERRAWRSLLGKMPHYREIGRIILAIAVERCDPGPSRSVNPGADRRALPIASSVAQQSHLRGSACEPRDLGRGRIIAAVIDI